MNYKKITYIVLSVLIFFTIIILLIVHAFNYTPETGEVTTTTKYNDYIGD